MYTEKYRKCNKNLKPVVFSTPRGLSLLLRPIADASFPVEKKYLEREFYAQEALHRRADHSDIGASEVPEGFGRNMSLAGISKQGFYRLKREYGGMNAGLSKIQDLISKRKHLPPARPRLAQDAKTPRR